jgi:uncharacterized protein YgiM (DUF1202 family)
MQPHRWPTHLLKPVFLCALGAGLSACALQSVKKEEQPTVQTPPEITQLEQTIGRQKNRIMQLELRLLAERAETQRLSSAQEMTIQEVVRVKAKLRSRNSKAETVANLAEVKLAIEGLQAKGSGNLLAERLERAQQYVAMSEAALEENNYDGASYLISKAKYALRTSMSSPSESSQGDSGTHSFSLPVRLMVTTRSNVRSGPGTDTKVLDQVSSGKSVSATGYRGLWVRIERENKDSGWIHYSLLKASL